MSGPRPADLETRLGYNFHDQDLLAQALTHRSHNAAHNERLEFLGDAVLDLVISAALYARFPTADEGQLSRLRAQLVRKPTLAAMARHFSIGEYLLMGSGEMKSAGYRRDSTLSDAFEAIIGAMYLDGGMDPVTSRVLDWFADGLGELSLAESRKDPKTRLQEYLQAAGLPLPAYRVIETRGDAHQQTFVVACECDLEVTDVTGFGRTRRIAEQEAAAQILAQVEQS